MNEETIKELLSVNFIRVIAEREGFIVTKVEQDYGDDIVIKEVNKLKSKDGFSYLTTGRQIGIQLKCTTEKNISRKASHFRYRLKGRNTFHLTQRKEMWIKKNYVPLILVLLVLPVDEKKWLELNLSGGGLTMGGKAYWYLLPDNSNFSLDKSAYTISIFDKNQLNLGSIQTLFQTFVTKNTI